MILENTPTLNTERLTLRKFRESDVDDILPIYSDIDVNRFLPWYPLETIDEARDYLYNKILPQYECEIAYSYAIELKGTQRIIGYLHIHDIGDANDVGYALAKEYWHKGYASEALSAVIEHLRMAGFPYVTATHDVKNPFSGEVMKKAGMKYRYSYQEFVQPKQYLVDFRMYQLNLDRNEERIISKYWDMYENHYIEELP